MECYHGIMKTDSPNYEISPYISFNQDPSLASPAQEISEVFLNTLKNPSVDSPEQKRTDTRNFEESFPYLQESNFQFSSFLHEKSTYESHNSFVKCQLTKPFQFSLSRNENIHFSDERSCFHDQGLSDLLSHSHEKNNFAFLNVYHNSHEGIFSDSIDLSIESNKVFEEFGLLTPKPPTSLGLKKETNIFGIEKEIKTLNRKAQAIQEFPQFEQPLQNYFSRKEEGINFTEFGENLSEAVPSKKLKVEKTQRSCSIACSRAEKEAFRETDQLEKFNDEYDGSHMLSSYRLENKEQSQFPINDSSIKTVPRKKKGFSPRQSLARTVSNNILEFLENDRVFREHIKKNICQAYGISLHLGEVQDYIRWNVKGHIKNYSDLWNAIGARGLNSFAPYLPSHQVLKRATWMVFQVFLGEGGHFDRWIRDERNGYRSGSRVRKGESKAGKKTERLTDEEKRRASQNYREQLRIRFERPDLAANSKKGKRQKNQAKNILE